VGACDRPSVLLTHCPGSLVTSGVSCRPPRLTAGGCIGHPQPHLLLPFISLPLAYRPSSSLVSSLRALRLRRWLQYHSRWRGVWAGSVLSQLGSFARQLTHLNTHWRLDHLLSSSFDSAQEATTGQGRRKMAVERSSSAFSGHAGREPGAVTMESCWLVAWYRLDWMLTCSFRCSGVVSGQGVRDWCGMRYGT